MALTAPPVMEQLVQSLVKDVTRLTDYLESTGHPAPSFDRSTPPVVLPDDASEGAQAVRERILDYALRIFQLAAGPSEYLANLQTGYHYISCLRWLCHFRIFHLVPLEGSIPYADLAALAKVPEHALKSITQMAMTNGLFVETPPGHVSHSATSALLQINSGFHDWAVFNSDISAPTALAMAEVHEKWKWPNTETNCAHTTQTAYNIAFNTDLPFFKHLGQQEERHRQFAGYMRAVTASQGTHLKQLVECWDWTSLGRGLVVDVGGSTGHASIALARKFPELRFIVEDLPDVVAGGPAYLESQSQSQEDADLASRITYQRHDFFEPQPAMAGDADVYLLRMILHDWGFDDCVRILSRLVEALRESKKRDGARILIMDSVLPEPGSVPTSRERLLRVRDLTMLQVFNSQERQMEDWERIFTCVDERLVVKKVVQPAGSVLSIIELALE
ncbi:O-methyltransferase-domain-containing protein [Aspergillus lucknowensis]|uniref:O-methyltransferase-domain-containing protein n=1 Tax=Aspergillus lucknowensis TaxID=176173 RepID=A0ABR4LF31_9EURO